MNTYIYSKFLSVWVFHFIFYEINHICHHCPDIPNQRCLTYLIEIS